MKKYILYYTVLGLVTVFTSCAVLSGGKDLFSDKSTFVMSGPNLVFTNTESVKRALSTVIYAEGPALVLVGCETVKVSSETVKGYTCKLGDLNPLGKITIAPTSGSINYASETHYRIDSGKIPVIKTINLR